MSKSENHWYLLGAAVGAKRVARRSNVRTAVIWLALVALFVGFYSFFSQSPGSGADPLQGVNVWKVYFVVLPGVVVLSLAYAFWRQRRFRAAYLGALQAPTVEPLLESIERPLRAARLLPDVDAFRAQSRAFALALYGRGEEARQELAGVGWASRAPLVQAVGLSGECAVALLCEGDAARAGDLARRALALSATSSALPGAGQAARSYETMAAAAEGVLGAPSAQALSRLEQGAADGRYPAVQLLAAYGLACACERSGDAARAQQLRAFLEEAAPHCAPLHAQPGSAALRPTAAPGPVSHALATGASASVTPGPQARATQRRLLHVFGGLMVTWLVLIGLFLALYSFFSQGG